MSHPAELAARLEASTDAAAADDGEDRLTGYGVLGLPFLSGHVLALRCMPRSSFGPGYRSIWHRDAEGRWTFFQDQVERLACTRYHSCAVDRVVETPVQVSWEGAHRLHVVADGIDWSIQLRSSPTCGAVNLFASALPAGAWRSRAVLGTIGQIAGLALRVGRLRVSGGTANGQRFVAKPRRIWRVSRSVAVVEGLDLGAIGPLRDQAHLADFWIPQRGLFMVGDVHVRWPETAPNRETRLPAATAG